MQERIDTIQSVLQDLEYQTYTTEEKEEVRLELDKMLHSLSDDERRYTPQILELYEEL